MNINTITLNSKDKKIRIMAATIELVAENGIHATPMSKVSKRANVAAGTIYHYFDNKNALIREVFFTIKSLHIDIFKNEMNSNLDFKPQFFAIWKAIYHCSLISGHFSFIEQCTLSPLINEETVQELEDMAKPIYQFFAIGKQQKLIKNLPNRLLFVLIFGSIASLAKVRIGNVLEINDELIDTSAHFCWDGIALRS